MISLALRGITFVSSIAILGSMLYYLFPVTALGLFLVTIVSGGIAASIRIRKAHNVQHGAQMQLRLMSTTLIVIGLGAWWQSIGGIAIVDAVRSPWGIIPPFAIVALGIALTGCTLLCVRQDRRLGMLGFAATFFSMLAMASVVYPLGYGFDPFLHRATVEHIAAHGTITPKPLYYIGQYALELVTSVIFRIPLDVVDRFLLPLLAATMLTASSVIGLLPILKRKTLVALLALTLLPLGAFVATTPQGIAYVFTLCAIALTFARLREQQLPLIVPCIAALAAAITHPFAGIPAVLYVAAFVILTRLAPHQTLHRATLGLSAVAALAAIPTVFALQAARSGLSLAFNPSNLFDLTRWRELALSSFLTNRYSLTYDALYLIVDNIFWIVAILAVCGLIMLLRERDVDTAQTSATLLPAIFALGMFGNFLILSMLFDFDFLISYERTDYALRSLTMAHLFLLPYAAIALAVIDRKLEDRPLALRGTFLTFVIFAGMANVYGAYPRHDNYARSAGFNVSQADFDAVYAIRDAANNEDYIALANQATSAAAVKSFGFAKYYHDTIFYYPIPTGGLMYEHFLTMVDQGPTRETMIKAMDLAGVNLAFFAVSDYWWQSQSIIENAKRIADDWFSVGDGAVTVFMFRR